MVNPGQTGQERRTYGSKLEKWTHMLMVQQVFPTLAKFGLESPYVCSNGSNVTCLAQLQT